MNQPDTRSIVDIDAVVALARRAGDAILEVYESADFSVERKDDDSPLTAADLAAHHIIVEGLGKLTPSIPVHSEESESVSWQQRQQWQRYWLVDPLDGTKEFIKRNGEFTVNIALIEQGVPILGVVHVPVTGVSYLGGADIGAFRQQGDQRTAISVRRQLGNTVVMVASRSHGTDTVALLEGLIGQRLGQVQLTSMGSSLKLCLVAEGKADIYPRLAPTCEWDTAAADAVVRAAGGQVVDTDFQPLTYNKENILNPHFLVLGADIASWQFLKPVLDGAH